MLVSQSDEDRTDSGAIERTVLLRERPPGAKPARGGRSLLSEQYMYGVIYPAPQARTRPLLEA